MKGLKLIFVYQCSSLSTYKRSLVLIYAIIFLMYVTYAVKSNINSCIYIGKSKIKRRLISNQNQNGKRSHYFFAFCSCWFYSKNNGRSQCFAFSKHLFNFGFWFKPKLNILLFDQYLPFSVSFLQKGETIVRISSSTKIEYGDEL